MRETQSRIPNLPLKQIKSMDDFDPERIVPTGAPGGMLADRQLTKEIIQPILEVASIIG